MNVAPFIHADNQTLYFTSNGLPGYGRRRSFYVQEKTQMANGANRKILAILSILLIDEGTLFVAADGKTAYYASDRNDSKGGLDIYSF